MENTKELKPWFKKWWGIALTIILFPILVPYLVWTQTDWNKWTKIAITVGCILLVIFTNIESEQQKQESMEYYQQAKILIESGEIEEAQVQLEKSKDLNSLKSENPAFELEDNINIYNSEVFLKESLANLSEEDFALLQQNELSAKFINHTKLNELFLEKMMDNAERRTEYVAEIEEIRQQKEAEIREEMIESQFSLWDGSHEQLTKAIKKSMNDPSTYEHVDTVYWDQGDHLIVQTTFRGSNAFGAIVKNSVKAKVDLIGNVIEIVE